MHRLFALALVLAAVLAVAVGGYVVAQDATPPAADPACATPATPAASPEASPEITDLLPTVTVVAEPGPGNVAAASPEASPEAADPCATPSGDTGGAATAEAVDVDFVDIAFVPAELTIPADTGVTFRFANKGAAPHNFTIDDPEIFSGDLGTGGTSEATVNLPAGTYEFYCSIPGHAQAGMVGTLVVR